MILPVKLYGLTPYNPPGGPCAVRLDANESYFLPSKQMVGNIKHAMDTVLFNRYPDPLATDVCKAFADFYEIDSHMVTAGNGSDELISILVANLIAKGDKILLLSDDFSMYRFYAHLTEAQIVCYQKRADLTVDIDEVIRDINENDIKLVLFSNPCNPTSLGIEKKEIKKLVSSVEAIVVLDEAYMDFWDQTMLYDCQNYENLVILRTLSKAIGLAGIRMGFAVANETITGVLQSVKSPYNVNVVSQMIASAVLQDKAQLKANIDKIKQSRDHIHAQIWNMARYADMIETVYDTKTNFVYFKSPVAKRIWEIFQQRSIAVRQLGDYIRITAGSDEENAQMLAVLAEMATF